MDFSARKKQQTNAIDTDLQAEVVAAKLLQQGVENERINFRRAGGSSRGVAKDVEEITVAKGNVAQSKEFFEILVNRNGIYDKLPEGIFYRASTSARVKSKEQLVQEIRKRRDEEFFTRRFFQLFEEEIDRFSVSTRFKELNFDRKNEFDEFTQLFTVFCPIIDRLEKRQAAIFLEVLPIIHRVRMDFLQVEQALALIFELPVVVRLDTQNSDLEKVPCLNLGDFELGKSFTLRGGTNRQDETYVIEIGPMSAMRYNNFCDEGNESELVNYLIELIFSANSQVRVDYKINREEGWFRLRGKEDGQKTLLGYSTRLAE